MKKQLAKLALTAALWLAITFTACEEKKKQDSTTPTSTETEELIAAAPPVREAAAPPPTQEAAAAKAANKAEVAAASEAEFAQAKAKCPYKKIGSPITVEAVFLQCECGEGCYTDFRLANGDKITLIGQADTLEEGTKVSITYQREQRWIDMEEDRPFCDDQFDYLESLTVLK